MNKRWLLAATSFAAASTVFSAAALAQTPSPTGTTTAQATVSPVVTRVVTGTQTVAVTGTVTGTVQPVGTQVPIIAIPGTVYQAGGVGNFPFAHPAFQRVWNRTDLLVRNGQVKRTYYWGPGPNTPGLLEQYNEDPAGRRQRLVQYFDKSRMELNNPGADPNQPFFVTNGLLTVELISGFIQVGEKDFTQFRPACIPMSGDFGDQIAPTYFAFQKVSNTQAGDNPAPNRAGAGQNNRVTATIDRNGTVGNDPSKATVPGTEIAYFENATKHNVPKVFFDFLNSSGPVVRSGGTVTGTQVVTANEQLSVPFFFASGLPISEAYWTRATIQGQQRDVMIQAFERRALTYVPTNEAAFQVEQANIGQHYFDWRYRNFGVCPGASVGTPTPPLPAPTGSVVVGSPVVTGTTTVTGTVTVEPTETATPCPLCTPTATVAVPPGSVVPAVSPTITTTPTAARTPTP